MFFRRLNWNIVGWFKIVSAISYAVIILGLLVMALHWYQTGSPLRLGLSFTGGTDVTVKFTGPVHQAELQAAMAKAGIADARATTLAKSGDDPDTRWSIETQTDFGNNTDKLWSALGTAGTIDRTQSAISAVGPSLSHEYLLKALEALVIAIGIQFVYIAFRFGWNYIFGLVTIIALVRDSLMMIGIYAIADKRVDDAFLAAVLTVIGYSVMDTIVILDRIRENTRLMDGEPYDRIVNTSILQTMTRSVNTLATVVITLVALLAFGGASLQNFAFALLVGICSGGYHSIFYSAPLVVGLRKRQLERADERRALGIVSSSAAKPRSVAEARAQASRSAAEREAIVTARRERREKEKDPSRTAPQGPARYKKRRPAKAEPATSSAVETMDPLDAQVSGLHDAELELGHEEIVMNLDDPATMLDHDPEHTHDHDQDHAHDHAHEHDHDHTHEHEAGTAHDAAHGGPKTDS